MSYALHHAMIDIISDGIIHIIEMWCHVNVVSYGCGVVWMWCRMHVVCMWYACRVAQGNLSCLLSFSLPLLLRAPSPRPSLTSRVQCVRSYTAREGLFHLCHTPPVSCLAPVCLAPVCLARVVCAIGLGLWFLVYLHLYVDVFLLVFRARTMSQILRALHAYIHAYIYMSYMYTCIHTYMYTHILVYTHTCIHTYMYYLHTTYILHIFMYIGMPDAKCIVVSWRGAHLHLGLYRTRQVSSSSNPLRISRSSHSPCVSSCASPSHRLSLSPLFPFARSLDTARLGRRLECVR